MNIINPKKINLDNIIKPIDDRVLATLSYIALQCKKDSESFGLRAEIYKSKYNPKNLERQEYKLATFLQSISSTNIKTEDQHNEYKRIKINTHSMHNISFRFYIAPNPENMHKMVEKLTQAFISKNISVLFKYQLTSNMESCDRIIIYSDANNKDIIEETIKSVYQSNPELFNGCERSIAWLYPSSVTGVYIAPETPKEAYSNAFSDMILEAKNTFDYIYGITNNNKSITFSGKDVESALENMKKIILSIMLRKGLLLSHDNKCIKIQEQNIKLIYDYNTGILEHFIIDSNGCLSVQYLPTDEGRKKLLENFYNVSTVKSQEGLIVSKMTLEERSQEVHKRRYPELYDKQGKRKK